eukprot:TRINITY_DN27180_c0_g1_i1.p1 TRINITY_DN27180_c0_g1~~TRINITY_DN27180_c0_g1_i1.p1  ORF type:complete len:553 (+),score=54.16 TRINITY_DN27180_c0_g1_i1:53-1711(+)
MATGGDDPLENLHGYARDLLGQCLALAFTYIVNNILEKRGSPVPSAIVTIILGVVFGAVGMKNISSFEDMAALEFMLVFAAPIIFAEGYGMKSRQFFSNIGRILTHAFLGTVVSSVVVAVIVFKLPDWAGLAPELKLSLAESLAFGAMISATDPVTTLAIFKDQNLVERGVGHLYYSVLGESILNDAVGVTLFESFGKLVSDGREVSADSVLEIIWHFCSVFVISSILGILFGVATAIILKLSRLGRDNETSDCDFFFNVPELGIMLIMSYAPFLTAVALGFSGFVAVMFAGISMRHYAHYNMTKVTRAVFLPTLELIANASETYVFLVLGIGCNMVIGSRFSFTLIACTFLGCVVGRAAHVYPLSLVVNKVCSCTRQKPLSMNEQHIVWFAGLRGAVAFMCSLGFPTPSDIPAEQATDKRACIIVTTIVIVLVTMVLFGWPTGTVLRLLNIAPETEVESRLRRLSTTARSTGCVRRLDGGLMSWVMTKDAVNEREEACNALPRLSSGMTGLIRMSSSCRSTPVIGTASAFELPVPPPSGSHSRSRRMLVDQ